MGGYYRFASHLTLPYPTFPCPTLPYPYFFIRIYLTLTPDRGRIRLAHSGWPARSFVDIPPNPADRCVLLWLTGSVPLPAPPIPADRRVLSWTPRQIRLTGAYFSLGFGSGPPIPAGPRVLSWTLPQIRLTGAYFC